MVKYKLLIILFKLYIKYYNYFKTPNNINTSQIKLNHGFIKFESLSSVLLISTFCALFGLFKILILKFIVINKVKNSIIPNPSFGCYETSVSNYFIQQKQNKPMVNISTHPNPINENDLLSLVVNIETTNPKSNYILILTDIMGKTFSYKLSNTEALQFISRGIYFVVIKHENETIGTIKLMLN